MRGFAVASVVLCACLVCAAAVEHRVVIDYSVPPRPAASPEDASDSLEQRVHELEALALDQGIVFNQEVIRLLASLQFLKAQPAVEYSGALLAAHDTADRYMQQCAPTFAECGLASAHASSAEVAANDAAGADDEMDLGDLRDRLLHTPREQRLGRRAKTMCAHRFLPCTHCARERRRTVEAGCSQPVAPPQADSEQLPVRPSYHVWHRRLARGARHIVLHSDHAGTARHPAQAPPHDLGPDPRRPGGGRRGRGG